MNKFSLAYRTVRSLARFVVSEWYRGTLKDNIYSIPKMHIPHDMTWAELLEEQARKHKNKLFLKFEDETFTYADMNDNANRMANFLLDCSAKQSQGVAMLMGNTPCFLDVFFGLQKLGMYAVPINVSLKGDSLLFILNHCDAQFLIVDESYLPAIEAIKDKFENIHTIIVNPESTKRSNTSFKNLGDAYINPPYQPDVQCNPEDICLITYTSGTTGMPKGVVYRYAQTNVKLLSLVAHLLYNDDDIIYTCMPLFHGNALFVSITTALHVGASVVLAKKFSARKFWDDIRKHHVTTFNTIGAMIPILLKQPERPTDNNHNVHFIISAACPIELWETFEKRFGVKIYETYGAIDGGGKTILNLGTGPIGSIGKPPLKLKYRLVDNQMNDVSDGTPGELIFPASTKKKRSIEYYKNKEASNKKERDGWIFTGDLMKRDKKGYLYFVGRNTESMRIKGENVSAYEVEQTILKYPDVLEVAVYAVPSELAEDDIMAAVLPVDGKTIEPKHLIDFVSENLPKFAVPRYIRIVDQFTKTATHRIVKKELESEGIVPGVFDSFNH
jgi:crotonobetaine/carnitine-CoA ligase